MQTDQPAQELTDISALSPIERLRIARILAPHLLVATDRDRASGRKVKTESGKEYDLVTFRAKLLERAGVEVEVEDGWRPRFTRCRQCKIQIAAPPKGRLPKACAKCAHCVECGAKPWPDSFRPSAIRARKGRPYMCRRCNLIRRHAAMTPEQRSQVLHKAHATRTPEQRSEAVRKANASRTPESRRENLRQAKAAMTPEQRSEAARKANASRTPDQRSEITRKGHAKRGRT